MKYELAGTGVAIGSEEEDHLELAVDGVVGARYSHDHVGMRRLLERVGAAGVDSGHASALDYAGTPDDEPDHYWQQLIDDEVAAGRPAIPPVYRVRIAVECEPLSDEESAAWWRARREAGK